MSNRLRGALTDLPRLLGCDYVFTGEPTIGQTGKPFSAVRTSFRNACKVAEIEGFRFHDFRHTAASHMAMAVVPLKTVGGILGHRTSAITERYSHLTLEHNKQAVEMLREWSAMEESGNILVTK
jgi:integrase